MEQRRRFRARRQQRLCLPVPCLLHLAHDFLEYFSLSMYVRLDFRPDPSLEDKEGLSDNYITGKKSMLRPRNSSFEMMRSIEYTSS